MTNNCNNSCRKRTIDSTVCNNSSADENVPSRKIQCKNQISPNDNNTSMNTMSEKAKSDDIDHGLYSRMLYVIGTDGLKKLASSSVLIYGMDGLGAEIAKNIVLGGISQVCLCDVENVTMFDLGTQFFCREEDIGNNRAEVTKSRIAELNNYVAVYSQCSYPTPSMMDQYDVIVLCNTSFDLEDQLSDYCHNKSKNFISVRSLGLTGRIFCDFGESFVVLDPHGNPPVSNVVLNITNEVEGVVTVSDEQRHGYENGTMVRFSNVKDMTELNDMGPTKIKYIGPYTFSICDTSNLPLFEDTAIVTEVIQPLKIEFKSLGESNKKPKFVEYDFGKFDYPSNLHLAYLSLSRYISEHKSFPSPYCHDHACILIDYANQINEELKLVETVNDEIIGKVSKTCTGRLAPIHAFIGGIASQEIMKACTHKFTPIDQFFYFEAFECLQKQLPTAPFASEGSRYDSEIVIFGNDLLQKMLESKTFIVGMGAIGCELLKCFALMGIGCSPSGEVSITDMDTIGKSNLNRQFLFRPWNIGELKTTVASKAINSINPLINIICYQDKIGVETESTFNDEFFEKLDCVVNALDNLSTRTYVDLRCVYYRKPLLESGTLGTKANTQVVIPYVTESYSSSQDPPEKSVPICTLKNFPNAIEHTIQWARDSFEELFYNRPAFVNKFLKDPTSFVNDLRKQFGKSIPSGGLVVLKFLSNTLTTIEECVEQARNYFADYFTNQIKQLLYNFPPDMETTKGIRFWFPPKKCPHPLVYNPKKYPNHGDFIFATANLLAEVYNIPQQPNKDIILDMADKIQVKPFTPKAGIKIAVTDAEIESENASDSAEGDASTIYKKLLEFKDFDKIKINALEFEKDDDTNFHMDFITACSNLRAENYDIEPADMLETKRTAGKIIPAIATTTSAVVGLVCLELIKLLQGKNEIGIFRNGFFDLADSSFVFSEPVEVAKHTYRDVEYTIWDRIEIQGEMTMQEFLTFFEEKYRMKVSMLSHNVMLLFASFMSKDKIQERLRMRISEIVESVQKSPIPDHVNALVLEISVDDIDTGESLEIPYIRYILPTNSTL
ncbi:hypothetical protein GJ496_005334 [Pomphorhynchus laevis]|nr:hypothetical protein GJ496_005334 [Pomphorhynchus laevis]